MLWLGNEILIVSLGPRVQDWGQAMQGLSVGVERFVTWTFSRPPQEYIDSVKNMVNVPAALVSSTSTPPSR